MLPNTFCELLPWATINLLPLTLLEYNVLSDANWFPLAFKLLEALILYIISLLPIASIADKIDDVNTLTITIPDPPLPLPAPPPDPVLVPPSPPKVLTPILNGFFPGLIE